MGNEKYDTMAYLADLHTHTVASGHAANTIDEMVKMAIDKGLTLYGITDHSMTMPGTCEESYFIGLADFEKEKYDIDLRLGVELNIIDYNGGVDMQESTLKLMDVVIASIHNTIGYTCGSIKENTRATIGAIENKYVNIIGHPDDGRIPLDYLEVVKAAKEYGKLLEINDNSLVPGGFRLNSKENVTRLLELCANNDVPVVIDSDAHSVNRVAAHECAVNLMREVDFPIELVLNYYPEKLKNYLK